MSVSKDKPEKAVCVNKDTLEKAGATSGENVPGPQQAQRSMHNTAREGVLWWFF
jgi:hypothetical protein